MVDRHEEEQFEFGGLGTSGRRVATAAVVVAVAIGVTVGIRHLGSTTSAAPQTTPTPSPSALPSTVVTPVTETPEFAASALRVIQHGELVMAAANGPARTLLIYKRCLPQYAICQFAWVTDTPSGSTPGTGVVAAPIDTPGTSAYPTGSGYVLKTWGSNGVVIHADGTSTPLSPTQAQPIRPDTVIITDQEEKPTRDLRSIELVNPDTAETWSIPYPRLAGGTGVGTGKVDASSKLWIEPFHRRAGNLTLWWLDRAGWHSHAAFPAGSWKGLAVWNSPRGGSTIAALANTVPRRGGGPTISVTTDEGATWHNLQGSDLPFGLIDSAAATSKGVLYIADVEGRLWRSTNSSWTAFQRVKGQIPVSNLQPAGSRVIATMSEYGHFTGTLLLPEGRGTVSPNS